MSFYILYLKIFLVYNIHGVTYEQFNRLYYQLWF